MQASFNHISRFRIFSTMDDGAHSEEHQNLSTTSRPTTTHFPLQITAPRHLTPQRDPHPSKHHVIMLLPGGLLLSHKT